jgi:uncharacterized protein
MTFGPYGKDVHLKEFMPAVWAGLQQRYPCIFEESSGKYISFETPDPEAWVGHGYAVVKFDSRGAGKSPGKLDVNSPAEFADFYEAIEWAGVQPWSSGKIGLLGISYYAAGQWMVASLRPPHLTALLPWQGTPDFYRDRTRQGGMFCNGFVGRWMRRSVLSNQYGNPESGFTDLVTGERNTGPASLSPAELEANRVDYIGAIRAHPLLDEWYAQRIPRYERIDYPALVVANWGGLGLHLRGTIDGFVRIASREKWLRVQAGSYFATFFIPESVALQRRFFDRYLKGIENGWEEEPHVEVALRAPGDTVARTIAGVEWPLPATRWTRFYLDADTRSLTTAPPRRPASVTYDALGDGVRFSTPPLEHPIEMAGPVKARLWVSSSLEDMDLFATLGAFGPDGEEVTFESATEPKCPVSQGWLRVTQRKLDPRESTEFRPWHTHDETQKLVPGERYAIDVEIWPMSIALPARYRLTLVLQGKDFERPGEGEQRGSGFFLHTDPVDRPPERFSGTHTIHTGRDCESYLLMPVVSA